MKRKIDIMSIIGLILAFGLMVFGIICSKKAKKTKNPIVIFNKKL